MFVFGGKLWGFFVFWFYLEFVEIILRGFYGEVVIWYWFVLILVNVIGFYRVLVVLFMIWG